MGNLLFSVALIEPKWLVMLILSAILLYVLIFREFSNKINAVAAIIIAIGIVAVLL